MYKLISLPAETLKQMEELSCDIDNILLIEEASEVIQCITKEIRNGKISEKTNVEIADLFIVMMKVINARSILADVIEEIIFKVDMRHREIVLKQ